MTRLVLLILLALATWSYFPETRAMLFRAVEPVVLPVVKWGTQDEMSQVARNAVDHERLTGQLPVGGAWLDWLDYRYLAREARVDPWGSTYQVAASADSVWVISLGPDRIRDTEDDFSVAAPRS
jgi:hypothetical protein